MVITLSELLKKDISGQIIVFETDTVYGIGCLYNDINSVKRIYEIKKREPMKPMALLCANVEQVKSLVTNFEVGEKYASQYWPGALTLIFDKNKIIDDAITANQPTVGVRIPDSQTALSILSHFGPMVVTSLNLSSEPAVLKYKDALKFDGLADYVVEGNDLSQIASTVYDPMNKKTLRAGQIIID